MKQLAAFRAYMAGSNTFLGVTEATLPNVEFKTNTMTGAGINGDIDNPTSDTGSMTLGLTWRTVEPDAVTLSAPKLHTLELRASEEVTDQTTGTTQVPVKITARVKPKSFDYGKLAAAATTDSSSTFEVFYYKYVRDGKTLIEIDKLNNIHIVNGVDYKAKIRENLGQ